MQQQKFLKRPGDEADSGPDSYEPAHKLPHNGSENLKFSVQIVQQLEFTTSAADSQPQQISTNVTVKALTNASVSTDGSQGSNQQQNSTNQTGGGGNGGGGNGNGGGTSHHQQPSTASPASHHQSHDIGNLVECKQEPGHDYSDLDDCAATVEKDFFDSESDTFKELISDLSDIHPGFLDFEEKPLLEIKTEDGCKLNEQNNPNIDGLGVKGNHSPMTQFGPTANQMNKAMSELSPAAQTLKHMAEQHQHKNAMGMGFPRPPHPAHPSHPNAHQNAHPNAHQNAHSNSHQNSHPSHPSQHPSHQPINTRPGGGGGGGPNANTVSGAGFASEFGSFNNSEFINTPNGPAGNNVQFHKGAGATGSPFDLAKQELLFSQQQQQMHQQQNDFDLKRLSQMPNSAKMNANGTFNNKQQQYSPYGSPGSMSSNHGSPGPNYMPPRNQGPQNAGGPPRPPSGPPGANNGANSSQPNGTTNGPTLQMKQTQQLHISQQGAGSHGIQVSSIFPIQV